jgi:LysM repeat protein
MLDTGYDFYFAYGAVVLRLPITPGELTIQVGSNNEVVTLINEGDINILKSPSLTEVEFTARFPMRNYPYAKGYTSFSSCFSIIKTLKENKLPFRFIVARSTPNGKRTWDTNLQVSLEDFTINENADEGDDVLIDFKLKQYKAYGVKTLKLKTTNTSTVKKATTTSTSKTSRTTTKAKTTKTYTVKSGDCLWNISKKYYGDGAKWKTIYNANKNVIEQTAKKYGKKSSSNGHWIYPGTKLTIPNV